MNKSKTLLTAAAISGFVAGAALLTATPATAQSKEKCAGVAMAGKNDCKTSRHSCAGQANASRDPSDWVYTLKGSCDKMGGKVIG